MAPRPNLIPFLHGDVFSENVIQADQSSPANIGDRALRDRDPLHLRIAIASIATRLDSNQSFAFHIAHDRSQRDRRFEAAGILRPGLGESIRRPLNDETTDAKSPEAIAAQATAAAGLMPPITLVGTVGTSLAMLRGPDGVVSVLSVGDQLAGAQVLAIRPAQIDVRFNSRTLTLDKPKETGTGISIHGPSDDRVEAPPPSDSINQQ